MLLTNWYSIFYWISVADGVKSFFDVSSNMFSWFASLAIITWIMVSVAHATYTGATNQSDMQTTKGLLTAKDWLKTFSYMMLIPAIFTWMGYVFCPSKKDALIIIAGGAVGNFITKDSSASQIPAEAMTLLRDKIRSEIREVNITEGITDTLENKSKEELIKLIKDKK